MNNNQQPQPKKVEQKELKHEYKVLESGEVQVIQKQTLEFIWDPRSFLSLYRQNEKTLENMRKSMSEEHLKKIKEEEEKLMKEQAKLKPIVEESEKLGKIAYDKMIIEGMTAQVKKQLEAKEVNQEWWVNMWLRAKQEKKEQVMAKLSSDEKARIVKVIQKLKRKGIKV